MEQPKDKHWLSGMYRTFRSEIARSARLDYLGEALAVANSESVQPHSRSQSEITLHLLRALLRQCTYLPDPAARKYIHYRIVSKFRKYSPRQRLGAQRKPQIENAAAVKRIPTLLSLGIKRLRVLIRANEGHPNDLYKVLATTYGRRGERKHELRQALEKLQQALKSNNILLEPKAVARLSSSLDDKTKVPYLGETMRALVKSQKAQKALGFDKVPIKDLRPIVDKENAWGRLMPMKRVSNIQKKWYAKTLDALLPPLPEHEWNSLGGLATGRIPWEGPVPRRSQAMMRDSDGIKVENKAGAGEVLAKLQWRESNDWYKKRNPDIKTNPHALTPRYMRGLWARVFAQCPVMKWDVNRKEWDVSWGNVQKDKEIVLSAHCQGDMSLFEDVDE